MVSLTGADVRCAADIVADFVAISTALEGTKWLDDIIVIHSLQRISKIMIYDIRYNMM